MSSLKADFTSNRCIVFPYNIKEKKAEFPILVLYVLPAVKFIRQLGESFRAELNPTVCYPELCLVSSWVSLWGEKQCLNNWQGIYRTGLLFTEI